jgi:RimJ/RimL family protein N-acetyltransferase
MRYAFDDLDLHLVELWTLACNERVIRAYQACGFTPEGVLLRRSFKDGSWHDRLIMSIERDEFLARRG